MEQIIAFGLGVLVVLTIVGVITMFKSSEKKINNIHRRIDEEVNRLLNCQRTYLLPISHSRLIL